MASSCEVQTLQPHISRPQTSLFFKFRKCDETEEWHQTVVGWWRIPQSREAQLRFSGRNWSNAQEAIWGNSCKDKQPGASSCPLCHIISSHKVQVQLYTTLKSLSLKVWNLFERVLIKSNKGWMFFRGNYSEKWVCPFVAHIISSLICCLKKEVYLRIFFQKWSSFIYF